MVRDCVCGVMSHSRDMNHAEPEMNGLLFEVAEEVLEISSRDRSINTLGKGLRSTAMMRSL